MAWQDTITHEGTALRARMPVERLEGFRVGYPTYSTIEALRRPPGPLHGDTLKLAPMRRSNGPDPIGSTLTLLRHYWPVTWQPRNATALFPSNVGRQ